MPTVQSTKKPNKEFSAITQAGLKAYSLFTTHHERLKDRVPADQVQTLVVDLEQLGVHVPGARAAKEGAKAATAGQGQALSHAFALVSAMRTNIGQRDVPRAVKAGWGVGARTSPAVVSHVSAAIRLMLDRAKDYPEEPAQLGVVQRDLDGLTAALASLHDADTKQEAARASVPAKTKLRNQTAQRIVGTTKVIAGAGVVEFAHEPERAEFQALIGAGNPNGKKGNGGGNGGEQPAAGEQPVAPVKDGNGKGK
jgi:hypothetical protein